MDALRLRLEEKESTLNKKSKQIQEMSEEKSTLNGEIHDLKDMLDVKERKVNVLQKKVGAQTSTSKSSIISQIGPHHKWQLVQQEKYAPIQLLSILRPTGVKFVMLPCLTDGP